MRIVQLLTIWKCRSRSCLALLTALGALVCVPPAHASRPCHGYTTGSPGVGVLSVNHMSCTRALNVAANHERFLFDNRNGTFDTGAHFRLGPYNCRVYYQVDYIAASVCSQGGHGFRILYGD